MSLTLADLVKMVSERTTPTNVRLVSSHLAGITPCLGDHQCRSAFMDAGTPEEWAALISKAGESLVLDDAESDVEAWMIGGADRRSISKAGAPTLDDVPEGAIMNFHAVGSTAKQDHEGDILHPEGAELDP